MVDIIRPVPTPLVVDHRGHCWPVLGKQVFTAVQQQEEEVPPPRLVRNEKRWWAG